MEHGTEGGEEGRHDASSPPPPFPDMEGGRGRTFLPGGSGGKRKKRKREWKRGGGGRWLSVNTMTAVGVAIDGGKRNRRRRNWVGAAALEEGLSRLSFISREGPKRGRKYRADLQRKMYCGASLLFV